MHTAMLRSPRVVKALHIVFFLVFNGFLVSFLYEVIADRITVLTTVALATFFVETIILVANRWTCPLTVYAEKLGVPSGRVTDLFLPRWIADRAYQFYGVLFAAGISLLVVRLLR